MATPAPTLTIAHGGASGINEERDTLLAVYAEVYAEQLYDPFFSLPRYWERLQAYSERRGFALVSGSIEGELVGYALGYTLLSGSGWWSGLRSSADPDEVYETGDRTFALNEIMVREAFRRRGYARMLHDALLGNRKEQRATLLVLPGNEPARTAYVSWGWRKLGDLRPFDDAPTYDAMVRDLPL